MTYANADSRRRFHRLKAIKRSASWQKARWLWREENWQTRRSWVTPQNISRHRSGIQGPFVSVGNSLVVHAGTNDGNVCASFYLVCIKFVFFIKNKETWQGEECLAFFVSWKILFFQGPKCSKKQLTLLRFKSWKLCLCPQTLFKDCPWGIFL